MKKRQIIHSSLCLLLALCVLLSGQVFATGDDDGGGDFAEPVTSGDFSNGLHWALDDNILHITGTGEMEDFEPNRPAPWNMLVESIFAVSVEEGVRSVGSYAFSNCFELTTVELSKTVEAVRPFAIHDCSSLTEVKVSDENESLCDVNGILFSRDGKTLFCFPPAWTDENDEPVETYEVPAGVVVLSTGAIQGTKLSGLVLPEGLVRLDSYAIQNCWGLMDVYLPSTLRELGEQAIYDSNLKMTLHLEDATALLAGIRVEGENDAILNYIGLTLPDEPAKLMPHRIFLYDGMTNDVPVFLAVKDYPFPALPTPESTDGARFHCWYYYQGEGGGGLIQLSPEDLSDTIYSFEGDLSLYAMWWGSVQLSLQAAGGTLDGPDYVTLSEEDGYTLTELPDAPKRTGWSFAGWYLSEEGDEPAEAGMSFPNGGALYAHWDSLVTFEERDAEADALETVVLTSEVGADPEPPEPIEDPGDPIGPNGEIPEQGDAAAELQSEYTPRWGRAVTNYAVPQADGSLLCVTYRVGEVNGTLYLSRYSAEGELLSEETLSTELPLFGGFFAGESSYYVVTGQQNMEENNSKEVIRVTAYDKDWTRRGAVSVKDCYTTIPFNAGSLRMAENGKYLMVHTCRQRYKTEDGYRHQSQLSIWIDTEAMAVVNDVGMFQTLHVSHSFNQFVLPEGEGFALLDHGDAYPRSVVVHNLSDPVSAPQQVELLTIPGSIGANETGVGVGGFAATDGAFTAAVNRKDGTTMLGEECRNVVILSTAADNTSSGNVAVNVLTDYVASEKCASTPYLVRLGPDALCALWEEYQMGFEGNECLGVRYVFLNGNATPLTDRYLLPDARLSEDCQPVLWNGRVTWFVNGDEGRTLYSLRYPEADADGAEIAVTGVEERGDELRVTVLNWQEEAAALCAWYDADGQFLEFREETVGLGLNTLRFQDYPAGAVCKVFLTNGEMLPVAKAWGD